jgi:ABC-type transport system substrate-binding protein
MARVAMQRDAHFSSVYTALRAKGQRHGQVLRTLSDRLLRILVAMLRNGTCYDASRIRRESVVQMGKKTDPWGLTNGRKSLAKVVKSRGSLESVFGQFNLRKAGSPWRDIRLRQAVNVAINREDLIRYATKGNGVIIPALLAVNALGYDPDLAPYAFDPGKARALLREAGYPDGLAWIPTIP